MMRRLWFLCVLGIGLVANSAISAASLSPGNIGKALEDKGWSLLVVDGVPPAAFELVEEEGLEVRTEGTTSILYRSLDSVGTHLRWRWRVDLAEQLEGDLTQSGRDDRPLALHLWFPKPQSQWTFKESLTDFFGYPVVGKALTYLWAAETSSSEVLENPHLGPGEGMMFVLRDATDPLQEWQDEVIDIAADYRRAFSLPADAPVPSPRYLAISADSDDLGGRSLGRVTEIDYMSGNRPGSP